MAASGAAGTCRYTADLELVASRCLQDDDPLSEIRADLSAWLASMFHGKCMDDPVFEGMVRDFAEMDQAFRAVLAAVESFVTGVDRMSSGLVAISETMSSVLARSKSVTLTSDACKYKECVTNMCRPEAPYSVISKFRRDLKFNVLEPLGAHIAHNRLIRVQLETRRRRLSEYFSARRALAALRERRDVLPSSEAMLRAKGLEEATRVAFEEVDVPLFEWLLALEEYRDDIYDSLLQTLKYLQFEFLAGASHCVSRVLPKRMEFRPLVEMTPDELRPQVQLMLQEDAPAFEQRSTDGGASQTAVANGGEGLVTATNRLLQLKTEENCRLLKRDRRRSCSSNEAPPADPMSVALLAAQGFEESAARAALRWHANDEQAALECLLERHDHSHAADAEEQQRKEVEDSVRIPSTLKWVAKLRDHRRRHPQPKQQQQRQVVETKKTKKTKKKDSAAAALQLTGARKGFRPQRSRSSRSSHSSSSSSSDTNTSGSSITTSSESGEEASAPPVTIQQAQGNLVDLSDESSGHRKPDNSPRVLGGGVIESLLDDGEISDDHDGDDDHDENNTDSGNTLTKRNCVDDDDHELLKRETRPAEGR